jgi:hypothetical protein
MCNWNIFPSFPKPSYGLSALCVRRLCGLSVRDRMAIVPKPTSNGLPTEFNNWVRNFVHYDTLTKSFQVQTTNARQVKDEFEAKIVSTLKAHNMGTATIQISNGRLQLQEDKHPAPLTFQTLTALLHDYYRAKGGAYPDETDAILKFIRQHRKNVITSRLKRDLYIPAGPDGSIPGLNA